MKNNIKQAIYETAKDLHQSRLISDQRMSKYEKLNTLKVHNIKPDDLKMLRKKENISQSALATCLDVSLSTVRKWESGEEKPTKTVLKLLNLIERKGMNFVVNVFAG